MRVIFSRNGSLNQIIGQDLDVTGGFGNQALEQMAVVSNAMKTQI